MYVQSQNDGWNILLHEFLAFASGVVTAVVNALRRGLGNL